MEKIKHKKAIFLIIVLLFMSSFLYVFISEKKSVNSKELGFSGEPKEFQEKFKENSKNDTDIFGEPLDRVSERINKKPFGLLVSPQNSPVSPERFSGYHTAIDLEIFPEESEKEIAIKSICSGKVISKSEADGYGGVVVQACEVEGNPVTIVYGHMKLSSISRQAGEEFLKGERIGLLGDAYSLETDGERKHLHLGIHKGNEVNILGYVKNKNMLSEWIDPCSYLCE